MKKGVLKNLTKIDERNRSLIEKSIEQGFGWVLGVGAGLLLMILLIDLANIAISILR